MSGTWGRCSRRALITALVSVAAMLPAVPSVGALMGDSRIAMHRDAIELLRRETLWMLRNVAPAAPLDDTVAQYRAGRKQAFGFLVGEAMKASGGKADPKRLSQLLRAALDAPAS